MYKYSHKHIYKQKPVDLPNAFFPSRQGTGRKQTDRQVLYWQVHLELLTPRYVPYFILRCIVHENEIKNDLYVYMKVAF